MSPHVAHEALSDTGNYWSDLAAGESIKTCKGGDRTVAFAVNPNLRVVRDARGKVVDRRQTASQVTMCPWFLEWAVHAKYPVSCKQHAHVHVRL